MKTPQSIILSASLVLGATASAATITWTGSDDGVSLFKTTNWDNPGGAIGVSNFKGVPVAHDFVVNNSTTIVGGAGGVNGTLDLGGTGTLTVTGSKLRLGAGAVIKDGSASIDGDSVFGYIQGTLDNADFVSSWGLSLAGAMHLTNGSTVVSTWFAGGNGVSSLDGGSILTIREDGAGTFNNNTVDFLDFNSTIVYSNVNRTIAEVTSEHLAKFRVNGAAAVVGSNILIYTDSNTGFTTVQAVPEPQTFALLGGLLALTSIMLRRRTS